MAFSRILFFLSIASMMGLILVLLQFTRRPLCIDSKIIEKIDRYSGDKSEVIYRCSSFKDVPFSDFFSRNTFWFSSEINKMYSVLESIAPFQERLKISLFANKEFERVQFSQVFIGEKVLFKKGLLQRNLARVWLETRYNPKSDSLVFLEDVFVGFLSFLAEGKTFLSENERGEDPGQSSQTPANSELRAFHGLLLKSMIHTFLSMTLMDRQLFLHGFSFYLANLEGNSKFESTLLIRDQKTIAELWGNSFGDVKIDAYSAIYSKFSRELIERIKILSTSEEKSKPDIFRINQLFWWLSNKNFNLLDSVTFFEKQKLLHTPAALTHNGEIINMLDSKVRKSNYPLSAKDLIVLICEDLTFENIQKFSNLSNNLMVVKFCGDQASFEQIRWNSLFEKNLSAFAMDNPTVPFVSIHLPSLLVALDENNFDNSRKIFECLQFENKSDALSEVLSCGLSQILGWRKAENSDGVRNARENVIVSDTPRKGGQKEGIQRPKAINSGIQAYRFGGM